MIETPVNLAVINAFIGTRRRGLAFPAWLESRLESDTRRRRVLRLRGAVPTIAVIYNLFLLPDILLIPDQMSLALLLHFAIVTPWIILTGWLTTESTPRFVREALAASIPVAIVAQILLVYLSTSSDQADHYQYYVLLVLLFTNTVQRLPFRFAVTVSCTIVVLHAIAIWFGGHLSAPAALVAETTMIVSAYLTLISNYYLESDARRAFLHNLRDQLNHAEVELAANHDALTGLASRHYLAKRLEMLWQPDNASASPVAIIMIDIDNFKLFNDRYGHGAGDDCLTRVAACAIAALRNEQDLAVRHGGEELLILLPQTDLGTAIRVADEIRTAVTNLRILHEALGSDRVVSISCGVASGPVPPIAASELISAADVALYAAKRNGRNQVWPLPMRAEIVPMRDAV